MTFIFQDNTFLNSLRVCGQAVCENLGNTNQSTINAITSAYEVSGDRLNVNSFDLVRDNLWFVGLLGIGMVLLLVGYFVFVRGRR